MQATETIPQDQADAMLTELRTALRSPVVRVEFDTVFSLSMGTLHAARVFLPGPTPRSKWREVGMRMIAPEGANSRAGIIAHLAELYGDDPKPTA